jgi:hypothetical protein
MVASGTSTTTTSSRPSRVRRCPLASRCRGIARASQGRSMGCRSETSISRFFPLLRTSPGMRSAMERASRFAVLAAPPADTAVADLRRRHRIANIGQPRGRVRLAASIHFPSNARATMGWAFATTCPSPTPPGHLSGSCAGGERRRKAYRGCSVTSPPSPGV